VRHSYARTREAGEALADRLLGKCDVDGECRLWRGTLDRYGYGRVKVGGTSEYVHHVAWWLAFGSSGYDSTTKLVATCPHRHCMNPNHWRLVPKAKRKVVGRDGLTHGDRMRRVHGERSEAERLRINAQIAESKQAAREGFAERQALREAKYHRLPGVVTNISK
jgi:hypothetical protein